MSPSNLVLVGEAWGRDEATLSAPFIGASGAILMDLLVDAGLMELTRDDKANRREYWQSGHDSQTRNPYFNWLVWQAHPEITLLNVFNLRPRPTNDVKNLCGPRLEGIPGYPALQQGKYVRKEYAPELDRLFGGIESRGPNLVIALGATPAWALLKSSGIRSIRGTVAESHLGVKVLPTYHPAAVMRDWSLRPIVLADLLKGDRERQFPEIRRPRREVWIEPSIEDLTTFANQYIIPSSRLSIDIETKREMITCVGFSPDPGHALVVPFYRKGKGNYWQSAVDERAAWDFVAHWCSEPSKERVFQNGMYDIHRLWRTMGIKVDSEHDTMLIHHAMQPELQKGLGFLGSVYTDEASWKLMRKGIETMKRED